MSYSTTVTSPAPLRVPQRRCTQSKATCDGTDPLRPRVGPHSKLRFHLDRLRRAVPTVVPPGKRRRLTSIRPLLHLRPCQHAACNVGTSRPVKAANILQGR